MKSVPIALALVAALAIPAFAEDKPEAKAKDEAKPAAPVALDAKAPAIVMQDTQGRSFELHDAGVTRKDALAVVMAKAKELGAAKDASEKTPLADLKGLKDDEGALDPDKVRELACAAGSYFGMVATEESVEGLKTLGDLVGWVASANDLPILLMTFSPRCGSVKRQSDRIVAMAAQGKVRMYAIACNTKDTDEHLQAFVEAKDWPIRTFWDRDQRVTDILGGKVTPHFFLFDTEGVLRYRGAMDNDPMGFKDAEDRKDYILDAAAAIKSGKEVPMKESEPSG